jgi:hypothetical protein
MLLLCCPGIFLVKGEEPNLNQNRTNWCKEKGVLLTPNSSKTINDTIIMQG